MIGRVVGVVGRGVHVLLVTDRDSGVAVRDARSGALGVLRGNPDVAQQVLEAYDAKPDMKRGDVLVTVGGESGAFPPDIPVGQILSVKSRPGDLTARVTVRLFGDATHTEFVRVLQWPVP